MKISVTFRNGEGENWQKVYAEERIEKLTRYLDMPAEAHIILSTEKFRSFAEINLSANGWNVNAKEEAKDMHLAIDSCIEKIEKQLKKQKEKTREHKPNSIRHTEEKLGEGGEDATLSKIVETRRVVLTPMSVGEALMEMEGSKDNFILYRDSSSENVSLIYRRDDGTYALVEANDKK